MQVIRSLPAHGEVTNLSASQRQKLQSLQPLLGSSEHPAFEVKVIAVRQAFIGLYQRAVLLLSAPALSLWTPEELQAVAAHEIGHEYIWRQYQIALQGRQRSRLQQLELYCDGIAILNLQRLGIDPSHLIAALEKTIRYNRDHYGRALNEDDYPTLAQRRKFHRALIRRMGGTNNPE
jgi:Peptidase family M48